MHSFLKQEKKNKKQKKFNHWKNNYFLTKKDNQPHSSPPYNILFYNFQKGYNFFYNTYYRDNP